MDFVIKSEHISFSHNYKLHLLYNSASDKIVLNMYFIYSLIVSGVVVNPINLFYQLSKIP